MAGDEKTAQSTLRHADHVCVLYETREEEIRIVTDFVREGLAAGERCLCLCGQAPDVFRQAMWEGGIGVDEAEGGGALVLLAAKEAYLSDGAFDAQRMLSMMDHALEDAQEANFAGLRIAGDMTWLLDAPPGADQLLEHEALVNQVFAGARGMALCFYHRRRTPRQILDQALSTHPLVVLGGRLRPNQFYLSPAVARARRPHDADVDWKIRELER
jgi:hypothetical protein